MEVGAIEGAATAGGHGAPRIREDLLPLRPPPVRAGHPGASKVLVVLAVLALCGVGAHLIRRAGHPARRRRRRGDAGRFRATSFSEEVEVTAGRPRT